VGILIFEDILAVIMLVILSGVALSGTAELDWSMVWQWTFFIGVFVAVVFFVGKLLAPRLLDMLNRVGSMELITLSVVGLVLGVSILAQQFQFSVALGAFLAGSILSQSSLCNEIERATESLRNIFCAVFFIAVGMMIEPGRMLDNWLAIVGISLLVVPVKVLTCWVGMFLAGQRSVTSFRAAVVKAQIGEFSFIIAGLGISLGVTQNSLMGIAVGVSLLSSLFALILTHRADALYEWLLKLTPESLKLAGRFYSNFQDSVARRLNRVVVLQLIRRPILQILLAFFLINGAILAAYFGSRLTEQSGFFAGYEGWLRSGTWLLAALVSLPFFIAIVRNLNAIVMMLSDSALGNPGSAREFVGGRVHNIFRGLIYALVIVLVAGLFFAAAAQYLPRGAALGGFIAASLIAGALLWRQMIKLNSRLEFLFMQSFNQQAANLEQVNREKTLREITEKYPWPVDTREVEVKPRSYACGKRIADLDLREETGASVIATSRSGLIRYDPGPEYIIFPGDHLFLFGSEEQIREAVARVQQRTAPAPDEEEAAATFRPLPVRRSRGQTCARNTVSPSLASSAASAASPRPRLTRSSSPATCSTWSATSRASTASRASTKARTKPLRRPRSRSHLE